MAFTSYRWKNTELNDGTNYLISNRELNLDDASSSDETWIYRYGGDVPIATGITVKEGVISLPIMIVANSQASFYSKLNTLKSLFDTTDPTYYTFERKLPHEGGYSYLMMAPRALTVNTLERKVVITLYTAERAWKSGTWNTQVSTYFANGGAPRTVSMSISYGGLQPSEPTIEIKALGAGTDGPVPLYYVESDVYVVDGSHVINTPLRVASGWDTTAHVSGGKMRSDGLDISVQLPDGTVLPRLVIGASNARSVWVLPQSWPSYKGVRVKLYGTPTGGPNAAATSIEVSVDANSSGTLRDIPQSGRCSIVTEILNYTGVTITSTDGRVGLLTGCTRGLDGTAAVDFTNHDWAFVKFPTKVKIGFGYAGGYAGTYFQNQYDRWPVLDYDLSSNATWIQSTAMTDRDIVGTFAGRPLAWRGFLAMPGRAGERSQVGLTGVVARGTGKWTLTGYKYGTAGVSDRWRLVMPLLSLTSRLVSIAQIKYTLTAGDSGQFPATRAEFCVTERDFSAGFYYDSLGQPATQERWKVLDTQTQSSGSSQKTTAAVGLWQGYYAATHLFVDIAECPTNSVDGVVKLTLDWVSLTMDYQFKGDPTVRFVSTIKGSGITGEFPVTMTFQNLTDIADTVPFQVFPHMSVGNTASYDCDNYTVTGAPLSSCTYEHPTWLRLLPGNNTIQMVGTTGIGQVEVTIKWKIKN
jgi:hypothetical protein